MAAASSLRRIFLERPGGVRVPFLDLAIWVVALGSLGFRLYRDATRPPVFDDLQPVWTGVRSFLHHQPVYGLHADLQNYLYPPSSLLLLLPLGAVDLHLLKVVFLFVEAAAMYLAAAVSLRIVRFPWSARNLGLVLLGLTIFEPARALFDIQNLDALAVLGEALALLAMSRGRWLVGGALLALTFSIKPVVLPLLLIPLLLRRWGAVGVAVAIAATLNAVGLLLSADAPSFLSTTVPHLVEGNGPFLRSWNTSLLGAANLLGLPQVVAGVLRLAVLGVVAILVWRRLRQEGDEALKIVQLSGFLMLATVLCFSFSFEHYLIYLLPFLVSLMRPDRGLNRGVALAGVLCISVPDLPGQMLHSAALFWIGRLFYTVGSLLLLAAFWRRIVAGRDEGPPERSRTVDVARRWLRAHAPPTQRLAMWAFRACVGVWVVAAAAGSLILAYHLPQKITAARTDESDLRAVTWSPIYGFAQACAPRLQAGAGILLLDPTARAEVTDPATRTGPAAFGDPNDVDWPNQAAFAYAVYPHSVTPLGHLPQGPALPVAPGGYVAVWQQADYRSTAAQSQAATGLRALGTSSQLVELCSYADRWGNRGSIFGPPPLAGPADPDPVTPPSHGSLGAYVGSLVGLAFLCVIGAALLSLAGAQMGWLFVAAALPLGCLAVCMEMLAFSVAGVRWSAPLLLLLWLPLFALGLWRVRRRLPRQVMWRAALSGLGQRWGSLEGTERMAVVALALLGCLVTAAASLGLPASDGFNIYYFKARAFFVDGSVIPYYRSAGQLLFSFPGHPPLIPLSVSWLYLVIGHVDEHATLLLWPALYASLLAAIYALVRTVVSRQAALWYTFAAALVAYGLTSLAVGSGYTDMPLALFLLLGAGSLWGWAGSERRWSGSLVQAGLFLGAAALTKEEGLLAALVVLTAILILTWRQAGLRMALGAASQAGVVFAVVVMMWLVLRRAYQLPVLTVDLGARLEFVVGRLIPAIAGVGVRALPQLLLAIGVLAAAAIVVRSRGMHLSASLSPRFWFISAIVVTLLGCDVLAIAAAPVELHYQISVAASRLISQVLPLALLALIEPWRLAWPGR